MHEGALLAAGHDCHIIDAGDGKVIRRARDGRNLEREASVMRHARRHGFPAPEVFDAEGPDILMERADGPSLLRDCIENPARIADHGRLLADLLRRLAKVRAPGWLPAADGCPGNGLLHLDLHPLNVIITADGPRVIDWANAARGTPAADVAYSWLALALAPVSERVPSDLRQRLLDGFLAGVNREAARPYLPAMAERRRADRNTGPAEKDEIDGFLAREARGG
jgi:tRNA A-37 threonylcarbamoyl transferase component Bud32